MEDIDDWEQVTNPSQIVAGSILFLEKDVRDNNSRTLTVRGFEKEATHCDYCGECRSALVIDSRDEEPWNLCLTKCIPEYRLYIKDTPDVIPGEE